jgi:RNA polymerase sigma-70 factor (ECF subfamily)
MIAVVSETAATSHGLLVLYDQALADVYGYLLGGRDVPTAQDLTSETFLAAAAALADRSSAPMNVAWLLGVARHKLIDHWRRMATRERWLSSAAGDPEVPWNDDLEAGRAVEALARLGPHHRSVLTLYYVDDLPVREVAGVMGRTEHATEALLVRARQALRRAYEEADDDAC